MADLVSVALGPVLDSLASTSDPQTALLALRSPLRTLRQQYRSGHPDFSSAEIRSAYAVAYHPYHAHLALSVLNRFADVLHLEGDTVRVILFGAGPAPELLAIVEHVRERHPAIRRIEVDLVDRETGWRTTRFTTVHSTIPLIWDGELIVHEHELDLTTDTGVVEATRLAQGHDLVCAQAVFTELRMRDKADTFFDHLMASFGPRSMLLVSDFTRMSGFSELLGAIEERPDLRTLRSADFECPMPRAPLPLKDLYTGESGLIERRRADVSSRLYVRTGWSARPRPLSEGTQRSTSPDQDSALSAMSEFFRAGTPGAFIVSGRAGTGKTHVIALAAAAAEQSGRSVQLWAPTGQAARRLALRTGRSTSTIHSALYGSPQRVDRGDQHPPQTRFSRRTDAPLGQVVFVDEASLIGNKPVDDAESEDVLFGEGRLLDDILSIATELQGQVVFVGDRHQLTPFGEDVSLALSPPFFEGRGIYWQGADLTTVHRQQSESQITTLAAQCIAATDSRGALPPFVSTDGGDVQHLSPTGVPAWLLSEMVHGTAVAVTFRHADAARWNSLTRQSAGRPTDSPVAGDHLVTLQASYGAGLLNGEELQIAAVGRSQTISIRGESVQLLEVRLTHTDPAGTVTEFESWLTCDLLLSAPLTEQHRVRRVLWADFVRRSELSGIKRGTEFFYTLMEDDPFVNALRCMYSYARTCHRAQGGEWDYAICDLRGTRSIANGQARFGYTALTRARHGAFLNDWPGRSDADARAARFEEFIDFARSEVSHAVEPVLAFPEDGGKYASLRRHQSDTGVVVNLWPSLRSHVQRAPQGVDIAALQATLDEWADSRLALDQQRPDPCLDPFLAELGRQCHLQGFDLSAIAPAEYQVLLTVNCGRRRARLRAYHRSSGEIGKELAQGTDGDVELLEFLRESVTTFQRQERS